MPPQDTRETSPITIGLSWRFRDDRKDHHGPCPRRVIAALQNQLLFLNPLRRLHPSDGNDPIRRDRSASGVVVGLYTNLICQRFPTL